MKTAMQELIEKLSMKSGDSFYALAFYHDNDEIIKEALEKEKEQIITAFEVGYKSCDLDETFEINRKLASGELHYNKTYNQNK
jgi:hypothetical protein